VRPLIAADIARVTAADAGVFGGDRRAVLEWALAGAPSLAWIVDEDVGGSPQYCFGRPGRLFTQVGPVVARDDRTACALVETALGGVSHQPVTVDAFDGRPAFTAWLAEQGFEVQRPLFRMCRPAVDGSAPHWQPAPSLCAERAIFGPEFA
jgi:hypothetical protein